MTVRRRLSLTLVAAVALLAIPLFYGTSRLAELRDIAVQLRAEHAEAFRRVGDLQASLTALDRHARGYVALGDPVFRRGMRDALDQADDALRGLRATAHGPAAAATGILIDSLIDAAVRLQGLVAAGRASDATAYLGVVGPLVVATRGAVDELRFAVDRASAVDVARAGAISQRAARTAVAGGVIAVLLALVVGLWVTARLTRPLGRLRDGLATVASGEFTPPPGLPYRRRDEIGDLARSFRSMTERLAELDRVKGEFVNAISHDLKAPLSMIGTCAELIQERGHGELAPEQRELVTTIRDHVRVLAERVNKLLHLSRLEAGAFPIQPEEVPVAHVFDALRRGYQPEVQRLGLTLAVATESSVPALMTVDADCLYSEILGNLVSNAIKFTPRGGRIEVRAWGTSRGDTPSLAAEDLHVVVADTGIGIPAAELPLVFLKYYQAGGRRRADGAGLGLAIVRQAVEAHGGTVTVDSTPGRGTSFHVTLPVAGPAARRTPPDGRPPVPAADSLPATSARWGRAPARELRFTSGRSRR